MGSVYYINYLLKVFRATSLVVPSIRYECSAMEYTIKFPLFRWHSRPLIIDSVVVINLRTLEQGFWKMLCISRHDPKYERFNIVRVKIRVIKNVSVIGDM